jgi:hypothetical protein
MSAQQGGPKGNFIVIPSDEAKPRRAVESPDKSVPFAREYRLGLMRAVLAHRGGTR